HSTPVGDAGTDRQLRRPRARSFNSTRDTTMDFRLNDEQRMMIESARQIGERFGLEYWRKQDAEKAFPTEYWRAVCEAGLSGVALPEEYGGSGLGMLEMSLIVEALAATGGGSTVGQLFMINPIFGGVSIARFGNESMRRELLPKLNGRKIWITGVASASKMLVIARTKKLEQAQSRTDGLSMFMIDVEREGLTHTPIDKLGTCTLDSSSVFFDNVRIEPHELIGTLHQGWRELLDVLNTERMVTTAGLVGTGELALRLAVQY